MLINIKKIFIYIAITFSINLLAINDTELLTKQLSIANKKLIKQQKIAKEYNINIKLVKQENTKNQDIFNAKENSLIEKITQNKAIITELKNEITQLNTQKLDYKKQAKQYHTKLENIKLKLYSANESIAKIAPLKKKLSYQSEYIWQIFNNENKVDTKILDKLNISPASTVVVDDNNNLQTSDLNSIRGHLASNNKLLINNITKISAELKRAKISIVKQNKQIQTLTKENNNLITNNKYITTIGKLKQNLTTANKTINNTKLKLQQEVQKSNTLTKKLQTTIKVKQQSAVKDNKLKILKLESTIKNNNRNLVSQQEKYQNIKQINNKLHSQLQELKNKLINNELANQKLIYTNEQLENKIANNSQILVFDKQKTVKLSNKLKLAKDDIIDSKTELQNIKNKLLLKQNKLIQTDKKLTKNIKLLQQKTIQINTLTNQKQNVDNKYNKLLDKSKTLNNELSTTKNKLTKAVKNRNNMQLQVDYINYKIASDKLNISLKYKNKINQLNRTIDKLLEQIDTLEN